MAFIPPILEAAGAIAGIAAIVGEAPKLYDTVHKLGELAGIVSNIKSGSDALIGSAQGLIADGSEVVSKKEKETLKRKAPDVPIYWTCSETGEYMRNILGKKEGIINPPPVPIHTPMQDFSQQAMDMITPAHKEETSVNGSLTEITGADKTKIADVIQEQKPSGVNQKLLVAEAQKSQGNDIQGEAMLFRRHRENSYKVKEPIQDTKKAESTPQQLAAEESRFDWREATSNTYL